MLWFKTALFGSINKTFCGIYIKMEPIFADRDGALNPVKCKKYNKESPLLALVTWLKQKPF